MRRDVVLAFLAHEARDLRTNARIAPVLLVFPLIGVGFPVAIGLLGTMLVKQAAHDPGMMMMLQAAIGLQEFQGLDIAEVLTRYMLRAVVAFYLLMPVVIASTAAALSIVGEKQQRTLEPILATPISDREFLTGKLVVCLVPTVAVTWATALTAVILVDAISLVRDGHLLLPDRFWLAGVGFLAPLLGAIMTLVAMRLSARSVDPQAVVSASALTVVPGFMVVFGVFGKLLMSRFSALVVAILASAAICLWLFRGAERTFGREEILTRWR